VPLAVHRAHVERAPGTSLEAEARAARYAALAAADADIVALAHHADDQAETLLLQLLRGAGPHGLAAMPAERALPAGPSLLRPFLALPRAAIDAYAAARGLAWVDDESNARTGARRNFLRHEVAPRLVAAFPGYPATLARAARHQAEAARLIDDLALLDAQDAIGVETAAGATLDRAALVELAARAPHRARNLLRWFLRQHELRAPSTSGFIAGASSSTRRRPPRSRSRGKAKRGSPSPTGPLNSCPAWAPGSPGRPWALATSRSGPVSAASASGSPRVALARH
jgi:tRNA(Ile)-lysidine synthase